MSTAPQMTLFGSTGGYDWQREWVIPYLLEAGVEMEQIYNPRLPAGTWTPAHQVKEDARRNDPAMWNFFHLCTPAESDRLPYSGYALVQLFWTMLLGDAAMLVYFNLEGMDAKTAKAFRKLREDVQAKFAGHDGRVVFDNWKAFVGGCVALSRQSGPLVPLCGTSGNSTWRSELLEEPSIRPQRFFNLQVPAGGWNETIQGLEDQVLRVAKDLVFCIDDPQEKRDLQEQVSLYSLVEAVMSAFYKPDKTIISIDYSSFKGHGLAVMRKFAADLAANAPTVPVCDRWQDAAALQAQALVG